VTSSAPTLSVPTDVPPVVVLPVFSNLNLLRGVHMSVHLYLLSACILGDVYDPLHYAFNIFFPLITHLSARHFLKL
jgi:hypothetical protein